MRLPFLRYSTGDTEKLKRYQSLHGNNWKKIGEMVSRSSLSVALKFSQISSRKWGSQSSVVVKASPSSSSAGSC